MAEIDLKNLGDSLQSQFRGLGDRHPGLWPIVPRLFCAIGVVVAVMVGGYFGYWQGEIENRDKLIAEEQNLRTQYLAKIEQAANLDELRKQKAQVSQFVATLEKQLPNKAEMDKLLSDINQAGLGRGLVFDLFQPEGVVLKENYAEQPIKIRIFGNYHDIAAFANDMAKLPRIVTLNEMEFGVPTKDNTQPKDGSVLELNVKAKTFRYLDPEEIAAQKKAEKDKKGAKK